MAKRPVRFFTRFAQVVARGAGHPSAFGMAVGFLLAWLIFGPVINYHSLWIDFLALATGIFTFLMVFVIQNTQNRDTEAIHLKLDELLRATKGARKDLIDSENREEEELDAIKKEYDRLAEKARSRERKSKSKQTAG